MMGELILRNLVHRPMRTFIALAGIGFEVMLIITIVGLTNGLLTETAKRIENIGADVMLQPPAASPLLSFSSAPMPAKIAERVAELKYVRDVAPALLQFNSSSAVETIWGIDKDSFSAVCGGFVLLAGQYMEGTDEI